MKDRFGRDIRYLRLSVTELCDLRCRYCMPADGVCKKSHDEMLTEDEMIQAVRCAARLGINKLRITGGEPLVKKNILSIVERCARVEGIEELCMTSNGLALPRLAKPLKEAGLDRINISLDTLDSQRYKYITRLGNLDDAMAGIEAALSAGFSHVKLNTVLIGGFNDDEIPALAELTRKYPLDLRFIEMMPMYDGGDLGPESFIPNTRVLEQLPQLRPVAHDGGVAKLYELPGAKGRIGLISPVNAHFCGSCNRIRLPADGKIKPCLHSMDEYSIKGMGEEEMEKVMAQAIFNKPAQHELLSAECRSKAGRNMNQIGG